MNKLFSKIIGASLAIAMMIGVGAGMNANKVATEANAETTYEQLTSIANIDSAASYVLGIEGTGFHYEGTSSWGKTALPSARTPLYYSLIKAGDGQSFKAKTTIDNTDYYLQIPTSNNFSMSTSSTAANSDIIIGTTQVSGTNYAVANKTTTTRHLRINGTNGLRSYAGTTGTMAYFYKVTLSGCSVTYNDGGATSGTVPTDDTEYNSGDEVTVSDNTGNLVKEDYTFGGWTDGTTTYQAGDKFDIDGDVTLTAVWNIEDGFDTLNKAFTESNSYGDWSNKVGQSGAVYAGNSSGGNDSIQLRNSDNSGIVVTTSAGYAKKVVVVWNDSTAAGRTLKVYGRNTAYSAASDLYANNNIKGTSLGTIVKGTSSSLTINDSYRYIGLCSEDGAMYLSTVYIKWEEAQPEARLEVSLSSFTLKTNQNDGVTVSAFVEDVQTPSYSWSANNSAVTLENANTSTVTIKPNTNENGSSTVTLTVGGVTPNLTAIVTVTLSIPEPGETAGTAYSVADAIDSINQHGEQPNVYVTGIISQVQTYTSSNHSLTYWISDDGTSNQFQVYQGKGLNGANFNSTDDLIVGSTVIVCGTIKLYNQVYEFAQLSTIFSLVLPPQVNSVTLTPNNVTVEVGSMGDIVDLFSNIVIDQDDGLNKTEDDIVWTSDNNDIFCVVDDNKYVAGDDHRTSTTIHAFIDGDEYASATVNVMDSHIHSIPYTAPQWVLVTDPSTLAAGDEVILTGVKADVTYAAGLYAGGNNVPADTENALTVVGNKVTGVVSTMIYTLEEGSVDGSLAFKDSSDRYLAAVSNDKNYLKTSETINGNSSFIIGSDSSIVAQGSYSRKSMRYNNENASNLFGCYSSGSTTGTVVTFYKLSAGGTSYIDLTTAETTAALHATEHNDGNTLTLSDVKLEFGAKLSIAEWEAIEAIGNVTDYGVKFFRTRNTIASDTPVQDGIEAGKTPTTISKGSGTVPSDPENSFYSFTATINITKVDNYDLTICAAPFIEVDGEVYFLDEVQFSAQSLAQYYIDHHISSELSDDALLLLA